MKKGSTATAVYRKDYTPYPWTLEQATLKFEIEAGHTRVRATLEFSPNPAAEGADCIELDGEEMELLSVSRNGVRLAAGDYELIFKPLNTGCVNHAILGMPHPKSR